MVKMTLVLVACALVSAVAAVSCLDENNNPVDFYSALKHPKDVTYSYLDAHNTTMGMSPHTLSTKSPGAIVHTLEQTFGNQPGVNYILWNDQTPAAELEAQHGSYGHTKGVIAWSGMMGFWLIHSVPNFPVPAGSYEFPENEERYGQSFMCISLTRANIDKVAATLQYYKPYVYDQVVSETSGMPEMQNLVDKKFFTKVGALSATEFTSVNGKKFTQLGKNTKWNQDIFEFGIAPHFKANIMSETWMNGRNPDVSFCKKNTTVSPPYQYDVMNIRYLNVTGVVVKETQDHAKWGVSTGAAGEPDVICVGGINRQMSQVRRAGGFVCTIDSEIAASYRSMVMDVDSCDLQPDF